MRAQALSVTEVQRFRGVVDDVVDEGGAKVQLGQALGHELRARQGEEYLSKKNYATATKVRRRKHATHIGFCWVLLCASWGRHTTEVIKTSICTSRVYLVYSPDSQESDEYARHDQLDAAHQELHVNSHLRNPSS